MPTKPMCPKLSPISEDDSSLGYPFTEEEYKKGIATLKNKKAAVIDDVLVEQLKKSQEDSLPEVGLLQTSAQIVSTPSLPPEMGARFRFLGKPAVSPSCLALALSQTNKQETNLNQM